jgi:hypothetical protein
VPDEAVVDADVPLDTGVPVGAGTSADADAAGALVLVAAGALVDTGGLVDRGWLVAGRGRAGRGTLVSTGAVEGGDGGVVIAFGNTLGTCMRTVVPRGLSESPVPCPNVGAASDDAAGTLLPAATSGSADVGFATGWVSPGT